MKICTKCKIEKERNEFTKCSRNKNGLHHCCKECLKIYRNENKDNIKKWQDENKDRLDNLRSKYRQNNKEHIRLYNKKYKQANKEKNREKINSYYRNKKKSDPLFKFKSSVRNLIYTSFKRGGGVKSSKTTHILGCSFDYFRTYIENQFNDNMSWDNYGAYWEFDHIKQLAYAKTFEDIIELNHYTNFQPLEVNLNRMKNLKLYN
jgi:hypothetical protein